MIARTGEIRERSGSILKNVASRASVALNAMKDSVANSAAGKGAGIAFNLARSAFGFPASVQQPDAND